MPSAESEVPDVRSLLNKRMTAGEAAAIITAAPVQVTGLMLPLKEWLNSPYVTIDYAGVPHWNIDVTGKLLVTETSAATISTTVQSAYSNDPYSSDGAASRTVSVIESYARAYTCAADGSIASAELLPAAGVGLKWVIWDLYTSSRASLTGGTGGQATLSDMASGKGSLIDFPIYGSLCHPGPYKQGTANTAVNISAVAGKFTNSSLVFVTLRCAKVA